MSHKAFTKNISLFRGKSATILTNSLFERSNVMQYFVAFLEGIITFISPCLLPMLPVYISYFAGREDNRRQSLINALGFVLGFTCIFVTMGAFAGSLGVLLKQHATVINIISGLVVILFGLNFLGVLRVNLFRGGTGDFIHGHKTGLLSSILFGVVFSIGWTPCVGAFLGSALLLASQQGSTFKGILMLLCYSLGLGIPFIISAILIDSLKGTFAFIKRNYKIITIISGAFLILVGILMMTGTMGYLLALLSF